MRFPDRISARLPALRSFLARSIDPALNVAIILVSVLILVAVVRAGFFRTQHAVSARKTTSAQLVPPKTSPRGIDWSRSEQTLLLFLNAQCGYCRKSEPFYRRLGSELDDRRKVRLIAFFPQPADDAKTYLDHAQIAVDETRQAVENDFGVEGTPTLLLLDQKGTVINEWVGLLSPAEEADVRTRLGLAPGRKPN